MSAAVLQRLDKLDSQVLVLDKQVSEVLDILLQQQTRADSAPKGLVNIVSAASSFGGGGGGSAPVGPVTDATAEAICEAFSVVRTLPKKWARPPSAPSWR